MKRRFGSTFLVVNFPTGPVASWLVRSSLHRVVGARALAGDILCSWARHSASLHPVVYYMGTSKLNAGGNPVIYQHPNQGRVEILLVMSRYRNQGKLLPDGPLGLYADLRMFALIVSAHPYCTCKFTCHVMHEHVH